MPANWRPAAIPLTGGLVTSTPPQSLEPGQFAQLDNAVFDDRGCPSKRHGSARESVVWGMPTGLPGDPEWVMGYGWAPSTHILTAPTSNRTGAVRGLSTRDSDLLAYDGTRMLLRSEATPGGWSPVPSGVTGTPGAGNVGGTVHMPHLETRHLLVRETSAFDVARGDHLEVAVCFDGLFVRATGRDIGTGSSVFDVYITQGVPTGSRRVGVTYIAPATGATYGTFVAFQNDTSAADLYISWASEASPMTWTHITVTTTTATDGVTIKATPDHAIVGWVDTGGGIRLEQVDRFGVRLSHLVTTAAGATYADVALHPDGRLMLAYVIAAATDDVYAGFYDSDFTTPLVAPFAIYTGTKALISGVTCEWSLLTDQALGGDPEGVVFIPGSPGGVGGLDYVLVQGSGSTPGNNLPRMDLGSRAFRVGNTIFLIAQYYTDANGLLSHYACLYYDHQANPLDALVPCGVWFRSAGALAHSPVSVRVDGLLVHTSGAVRRPYDPAVPIHGVTLDFGAPLRSVQAGRTTYFAGAQVWEYDGSALYEAGFHDFGRPTLAGFNGAGGLTASSTYTYRFYLVHKNAQGEISRSAAITQTVTLAVGEDTVSIVLPAMPLLTRPGAYWETFRSQANGSVLTRTAITSAGSSYDFFPTSRTSSVSVTDEESDSAIVATPIDPVPFGVLDNVAPPACSVIVQGKDRVWYSGGDLLPGQVAYSKFWDPGETPGWNEALLVETDRTGPVTLVGFVGDWLITGSRQSLYQFAGDGPSNLGLGDFTPARLISSDTGCVNPDSVLLTPVGIAFRSQKGVRVLGPGGALISDGSGLLGSTVDPSFSQDVIGSCVVPGQDQCRWMLADGSIMVWDFSVNKWTRWTGYSVSPHGSPATLRTWSGRMAVAEPDSVLLEDSEAAVDGARAYRFIGSLGWMGPHGALNWGRLRRWGLEGSALGPFTAKVFIDYDYKDGPRRQTYTWAASTSRAGADGTTYDHDPGSWGSDSAWGASPSWGGDTADGGAFPVNVRFNRQKATAFRFTITDDGEPNLTLALRTLNIEFAPMTGLVRVGGRNL